MSIFVTSCLHSPGPSVVACWRGVWDYSHVWLEEGLCQGQLTQANILAFLAGLLVTAIIDLNHCDLSGKAREVGGVVEAVMRHLFSITWGFFDIIFWKGLWDGYDHLAGSGLMQSLGTTVVGLAILSTTRTMKSATSMPVSSNTEGRGRLIPEFSVP